MPRPTSESAAIQSPAKRLAGFIAKFDPSVATLIRSCRAALRKRMPTAYELVYDNYNFFVIGYCSAPRASDCIVSLACSAKGVSLCFYYGAALPDPKGILHGGGNQARFLTLDSANTLKRPEVERLLAAAIAHGRVPLPKTGGGELIIKSVSAKQRPRRKPVKQSLRAD